MSGLVFEGLLSTPEMQEVFDDTAIVQAMMDFEAALVRAQAKVGVIPQAAAQAIASLCRAELYDVPALLAASRRGGGLSDAVARKLADTVALFDPVAAGYVQWGSRAQNMVDTAMSLQSRKAMQLIEQDLLTLCGRLLDLAERHGRVAMLDRSQVRPCGVSSLRARLMAWLGPLLRSAQALRERANDALILQFDGLGEPVAQHLAQELQLPLPNMPWIDQRDRVMRLAADLGVLCGALGKLAIDVGTLSDLDCGELSMASGGKGATACSHPAQALTVARRAPQRVAGLLASMSQDAAAGVGAGCAERAEWVALLVCSHGAVKSMMQAAEGLQVQGARMLENIDAQQDLGFAEALLQLVGPVLGGVRAQAWLEVLVDRVRRGDGPLRVLARGGLAADPEFAAVVPLASLEPVFDVHAAASRADEGVARGMCQAREHWTALMDCPVR